MRDRYFWDDEPEIIEKEREQPALCKGCVWGSWDGVKQFCPHQACVKISPVKGVGHRDKA